MWFATTLHAPRPVCGYHKHAAPAAPWPMQAFVIVCLDTRYIIRALSNPPRLRGGRAHILALAPKCKETHFMHMRLCFSVIRSFLPSLPRECRHTHHGIKTPHMTLISHNGDTVLVLVHNHVDPESHRRAARLTCGKEAGSRETRNSAQTHDAHRAARNVRTSARGAQRRKPNLPKPSRPAPPSRATRGRCAAAAMRHRARSLLVPPRSTATALREPPSGRAAQRQASSSSRHRPAALHAADAPPQRGDAQKRIDSRRTADLKQKRAATGRE